MPSSSLSLSEAQSLTPGAAAAFLARCTTPAAAAAIHARLLRCSRAFFCSPYLANCLAATYSRLGAASSAIALLTRAPAAKPNVFSHNILLAALVSSGLLDDARRLFDGMPRRDAVSYNSIISGYIAHSRPDDAFQIVYDMRAHGVQPTGFTFSIVSSAVRSVWHGLQLHGAAIRHDLAHRDAVVGNALIDMYRRIGLVQYAVRVFSCMHELDAASWNSVMAVYKDQSHSTGVFECFQAMRSKGLSVDGFTVSTVLSACSDMEGFTQGDQILALCLKAFQRNGNMGRRTLQCDDIGLCKEWFDGRSPQPLCGGSAKRCCSNGVHFCQCLEMEFMFWFDGAGHSNPLPGL